MAHASAITLILLRLLQFGMLACAVQHAQAERLPGLSADLSHTSVSGISSGGYMAVQFHVAHSAGVIGVGVLAAGPYYCAQGSAWTAAYNCMGQGIWAPLPSVSLLEADTQVLARSGQIDTTDNLRSARVWLFTGKRDATVSPVVVAALKSYYENYVEPAAIAYVDEINAGHAMVTADHGASCASSASPYINDCHFDAVGQLLSHINGHLDPPVAQPAGRVLAFDQNEFAGDAYRVSLANKGYVYGPTVARLRFVACTWRFTVVVRTPTRWGWLSCAKLATTDGLKTIESSFCTPRASRATDSVAGR